MVLDYLVNTTKDYGINMEQNEVSLIALSSPSAYTGVNSAEQLVAYAARVSNPANQNNTETAGFYYGSNETQTLVTT